MTDKGTFTVYTATHTGFLVCCKDYAKPCNWGEEVSRVVTKLHTVLSRIIMFLVEKLISHYDVIDCNRQCGVGRC